MDLPSLLLVLLPSGALSVTASIGSGEPVPVAQDRTVLFEDALSRLGHPTAEARNRAQRDLSRLAVLEDQARICTAAREGGPEVQRRLVDAFGAEDRHLGLSLALMDALPVGRAGVFQAGIDDPAVEVGREAFLAQVARAMPGTVGRAQTGRRLRESLSRLAGLADGRIFKAQPNWPLRRSLDALVRAARPAVPIAWDPALRGESGLDAAVSGDHPGTGLVGTWPELLLALAEFHGAEIEGIGLAPGDPVDGAFLLVVARGDAGRLPPWKRLAAWGQVSGGENGARSLAATGWGAGLSMLAQRWERGSDDAFAGLLLAAGRGRVAPALRRPGVLAGLLARCDRALETGEREEARGLLSALGRMGGRDDAGTDLGRELLLGWDSLGPLQRWSRLALLEDWAETLGPAGIRGAQSIVGGLIAAPDGSLPDFLISQAQEARQAIWGANPESGGMDPLAGRLVSGQNRTPVPVPLSVADRSIP